MTAPVEQEDRTKIESPTKLPPGFFAFTWRDTELSAGEILHTNVNTDSVRIEPGKREIRFIFSDAEIVMDKFVTRAKGNNTYNLRGAQLLLGAETSHTGPKSISLEDAAIRIVREDKSYFVDIILPKDPILHDKVRIVRLSRAKPPQELFMSLSDENKQEVKTANILYRRSRLRFSQLRPSVFAPRQRFY